MIDVYFLLKGNGDCVGGISLKEKHPTMNLDIWETYRIYPVTEKTILFKRKDNEFCTTNGIYKHEMGQIEAKIVNGMWLNINVKEL